MRAHSSLLVVVLITAGLLQGCPSGGLNPPDGGADGGADGGLYEPGSRMFLETCEDATDCQPGPGADAGICNFYAARNELLCTRACTMATAPADCPSPSPGCNNMGVCKAP